MTLSEARYLLHKTRQKYLFLRVTEILLVSLAVTFVILFLCFLFAIGWTATVAFGIVGGLVSFVLLGKQLQIFDVTQAGVAKYLNSQYSAMEESADLLLKEDEDLTSLQQLQKDRSVQQFSALYPTIRLPNRLIQATIIFVVTALIYFVTISLYENERSVKLTPAGSPEQTLGENLPPSIQMATITLTPPSYTNIPKKTTGHFNLHIPEGTLAQWEIDFKGSVAEPQLIFSGQDSAVLGKSAQSQFLAQRILQTSGFYQVTWKDPNGSKKSSDYYQIEIIKDQAPIISIDNLNQFTELTMSDNLKVDVTSSLSDEYGLRDGYLIATVSKGSGEAIKFRELKMSFDKPKVIEGKKVKANVLIDIVRLGLEPGDELYFYVEALDNKTPVANRSRTETFFISLQDTSSMSTSVDPGLGVDLMPEYFRSQRQIIIDSEKLLKERKKITKGAFNSRSNSLAYDQKVLRLRYGEFLGEEFESGIGPQTYQGPDEHEEEDATKKYGHVHDKDNEHNLVEEKKSTREDSHKHNEDDGDKDPLKEYVHAHDSQEEATFFTQSIRAKLKAAITIMWDAELHLRMYDPTKSLPFQYKALKLLKEISQDSRVYVHRTGFDPPPLKEEKRLTGDLTEIRNSTSHVESLKRESYPSIRKALRQIEMIPTTDTVKLTSAEKIIFDKAAGELTVVAIEQPGRYLKALSLLRALSQNELEPAKRYPALMEIRKTFWNLLPEESESPQVNSKTSHQLDEQFLITLEELKH